jgi:predicted AAA+ superfamily ATPase
MENVRSTLLTKVVESLHNQSSNASCQTKSKRLSSRALTKIYESFQQVGNALESTTNDFKISKQDKLVGRDTQLLLLSQCFSRIMADKLLELVVIHGTSGSGKSSLVQEFMKNLPPEVFHVQGKFNQL